MNTLMRYSPDLASLRDEVDRLFDSFFRADGNGEASMLWRPSTDLSETEDRYILRMDMPGLSKEDLAIELCEGVLSISGERKSEHEEKKENVQRIERSYGRFYRSFSLPHAGEPDGIKARMENGVLTVEVPKREESKPHRIQIS